ncbi:MAG: hypothetical protein IT378_22460 [Sandaracinaceae bacterium]|nr:hypothetical protein [Sandaracinaceae bacterium]
MRRILPLTLWALFVGCATHDEELGKLDEALSRPGRWSLPGSVEQAGDTQHVGYTGAGPWRGTSGCGGGMRPGTAVFRDFLRASFPQISSIGGYSCRPIVGNSSAMSVHATGRALDVMIRTHNGSADNDLGDPIAHWLIEHAEHIGIQLIIWDRSTWNASRRAGDKHNAYTGQHPHHDHLHVELSVDAGEGRTPWFAGAMEPPVREECPALAAEGGIVSERGACFALHGPSRYWRNVDGAGHGGSLYWTNAFQNDSPSNWARWQLRPSEPGEYEVEVRAEPAYAVHRRARYNLFHGGAERRMTVDLSQSTGWLSLGRFQFAADGREHLSVYDHDGGPVASRQHIPADAVRLTRITAPAPEPEPAPAPAPAPDPAAEPAPAPEPSAEPSPYVVMLEPALQDALILEGDPRVDDDHYSAEVPAYEPPPYLTSSCAVSLRPAARTAPWLALLLAGAALVTRRRKNRD